MMVATLMSSHMLAFLMVHNASTSPRSTFSDAEGCFHVNGGHRAIAVGAIRNSNGGISSSLAADCVFGMAGGTGSHADTVLHQVLVARL